MTDFGLSPKRYGLYIFHKSTLNLSTQILTIDWIYRLLYDPCTDVNKMFLFKTGPNVLRESWGGDGERGREQNRVHGGEHRPAIAPADWVGVAAEVGR